MVRVGQTVAYIFIAIGLFSLFARSDVGGLWLAFIGWFLLEGAQAYYTRVQLSNTLPAIRVADVMATDCAAVDANTTLRRFVEDQLMRMAARCFAVAQDGHVIGLITADDVKRIGVRPDVFAGDALELIGRENVNQLPVLSDGSLQGIVTRSYLVHLWRVRRELTA